MNITMSHIYKGGARIEGWIKKQLLI